MIFNAMIINTKLDFKYIVLNIL